eukprot:c8349_g1_i2.p1 GENE.c8349_g1_i2~~c8349_g1_i2.p1  ORF type:complete len:118 (+),score=10.64 c8349_g1_i2:1762-2115(+)
MTERLMRRSFPQEVALVKRIIRYPDTFEKLSQLIIKVLQLLMLNLKHDDSYRNQDCPSRSTPNVGLSSPKLLKAQAFHLIVHISATSNLKIPSSVSLPTGKQAHPRETQFGPQCRFP